MATSITFAIPGGSSITIQAPAHPGQKRPRRQQVRNAAIGGRVVAADLGDGTNRDQPRLVWTAPGMPRADRDALVGFLDNDADLSSNAFVFTDWDDVDTTVKYWDGRDTIRRIRNDRWIAEFELLEVPT